MARPRAPLAQSTLRPTARYDAAGMGRRIAAWRPPSTGPQRATEGLSKLRDRARDAARNDWAASSAGQKWSTNLIGVGIQPHFKRVPEGERRVEVVDLWNDWVAQADADGVLDYYGLQTLGVRSWFDSGEVFVRLRPRRLGTSLKVPFQIQLVEADYVPHTLTTTAWRGMAPGNRIVQGIEITTYGQRVAYWMYREHPGDTSSPPTPEQLIRVPADLVRHMFEPTRPGQMRGVSQLSASLIRLRMAGDLEDVVLDRQRLANLFMAVVTKQMPADLDGIDIDPDTGMPAWYTAEGRGVVELGSGVTQELLPGENMTFANPPEPGIAHSDYMRTVNMGTSAQAGLPYEIHSGDIRGVSDRTLRVLILEFRRLARQRQWQLVIPKLCQPAVDGFAQGALLAGHIGLDEYDSVRRVTHAPEGWEHIHPVQDPQGKILEIEAGLRSRDGVIAERGDDPATVDQERRDGQQRATALGLAAAAAK
jgi:lambda family phage portal protein